ncbi:unnamed protein product [Danaus chrysippus]|uniref:(African queen) hypothetical protein n=1 Tax=Danaus chrysippus TaxID=151541 RepID=A0A8J2QHN0_9NEOP|nr:unnamed protein product [Danaus chrysippus]
MADGSPEDRAGSTRIDDLTFSASEPSCCDTKKCSGPTLDGVRLKLSFYTELDSCENCETRGVVAERTVTTDSRKTPASTLEDGDDRKKRCFDRYDSSESSDSRLYKPIILCGTISITETILKEICPSGTPFTIASEAVEMQDYAAIEGLEGWRATPEQRIVLPGLIGVYPAPRGNIHES